MKIIGFYTLLIFLFGSDSSNAGDFYEVCGKVAGIASSGTRLGITLKSSTGEKISADVWIGGAGCKPDHPGASICPDGYIPDVSSASPAALASTQRILTLAQAALSNNLEFCIGSRSPLNKGTFEVRDFDSVSIR